MKRSSIIGIVIILGLIYIGLVVGPMYYKNQMMVFEVKGEIKVAHLYNQDEILEHIIDKVKEWDLPVPDDEIVVDRREEDIIITLRYHVDKKFIGNYKRRFYFKIREKGKIKLEY